MYSALLEAVINRLKIDFKRAFDQARPFEIDKVYLNEIVTDMALAAHVLNLYEAQYPSPLPPPAPKVSPAAAAAEALAADLIAQERAKRGVKPLALNAELSAFAREHSVWVLARPYGVAFDPTKRDGKMLWQVFQAATGSQRYPFEVIADRDQSVEMMHARAIKNTKAYNSRMLNRQAVELGVGAAVGRSIALTCIYAGPA